MAMQFPADQGAAIRTALLLLVVSILPGVAQAQNVYKHVDEKGNVTYSQTPPAGDSKKIKVPPPRLVPTTPPYGRTEEYRALRRAEHERRRLEYERRAEERREALEDARRRQTEALRAECERNRGTDCQDPATPARMAYERGPSRYRPRAR